MYGVIYVICVAFVVVFAEENGDPCLTPNGEKATCISINSCQVIKQAIQFLDEDAVEFAKKSQCGYDGSPLVCCGSEGGVTDPHRTTTSLPHLYEPEAVGDITYLAQPIRNILLPDSSLCGLQSKSNSYKGRNVTEHHEYPWMVTLNYKKKDGSPAGSRCSGTLINHRYVLTAAQCLEIDGYELTEIHLGEWNFNAVGEDYDYYKDDVKRETIKRRQNYKVIEKIPHPYFNKNSLNNDIALVRIEEIITYNQYIRPICLPPRDFLPPPADTLMETMGWDATEDGTLTGVKVKANYSKVSNEQCNATFANYSFNFPHKVCAKAAKNSVVFDSGRPLLRNYVKDDPTDEPQWFQEGILYKPTAATKNGDTILYMRVSKYITWILNNVRKS